MVILPYKDRFEPLSKYLQQLIMESLGKEKDLSGKIVNQGICVFGNKGSTDQHAYIQQLRDGINNFFVTFIQVLEERRGTLLQVEPNVTAGDYLQGFLLGTRQALFEKDRESMTITIQAVSPFSVGVLIALFERAVGFYASLININAYHQPGVEAGKIAGADVIGLELKILKLLSETKTGGIGIEDIGRSLGMEDEIETIFKICEYLASNPGRGIVKDPGKTPFKAIYRKV